MQEPKKQKTEKSAEEKEKEKERRKAEKSAISASIILEGLLLIQLCTYFSLSFWNIDCPIVTKFVLKV
jgi:hypothetical protein